MAKFNRKVFLDARMIGHSGIGTHIRGLLEGWRAVAPEFRPTLLGDPATVAASLGDDAGYPVVAFRAPIYGAREQVAFPARRTRGALLHCPHYNIALRHSGPLVVTIHDLIHLHERWGVRSPLRRLYARWMMGAAARRARHVFVVSQATADDLIGRFGVARDRISVVYNAPSDVFRGGRPAPEALDRFRREMNLSRDYLLTIGLLKPHKNIKLLLEAFKSLRANGRIGATLVVGGLQEKERPVLRHRLAALGMTGDVRVLERLPGNRLPLLFGGAQALIHPALLEGFGLPVVEAQAVGTPVVASRASAVPEVAGEGALYFDPHDAADLAGRILAVVEDSALRERLVAEGYRNVERFSWRESAGKVLAVYEQVG